MKVPQQDADVKERHETSDLLERGQERLRRAPVHFSEFQSIYFYCSGVGPRVYLRVDIVGEDLGTKRDLRVGKAVAQSPKDPLIENEAL